MPLLIMLMVMRKLVNMSPGADYFSERMCGGRAVRADKGLWSAAAIEDHNVVIVQSLN